MSTSLGALAGTSVLVSGGTGSFGSTVVKRLLQESSVSEVRVLSRDETKQDAFRRTVDDPRLRFYLGDVRDPTSVERAMRGAELVFHAAALKQVPSCEFFPLEAVKTNVLGTANVLAAAQECGVTRVICLSTDKAVYPINAMGMSKALMEKIVQSMARVPGGETTTFATTRYGNVLMSRGSLVPLIMKQMRDSGVVTVTHPGMTRFVMSLEDSVDLVLFALDQAQSGDLFVRKAPAATVEDIVAAVARILNVEVRVERIGIRHGEKMHESLLTAEEVARAEDLGNFFRVPLDSRSLNYSRYVESGDEGLAITRDYNSAEANRLSVSEVESLLRKLPEFSTDAA